MLKASGVKNVSIFLLGSLILQNAVAGKHRIIAVISTDYMGSRKDGQGLVSACMGNILSLLRRLKAKDRPLRGSIDWRKQAACVTLDIWFIQTLCLDPMCSVFFVGSGSLNVAKYRYLEARNWLRLESLYSSHEQPSFTWERSLSLTRIDFRASRRDTFPLCVPLISEVL